VECSEGEDSTRALAGLLAQRNGMLMAEGQTLTFRGILFRKPNRVLIEEKLEKWSRRRRWQGFEP
jgi:hypothetical protein